MMSPLDDLPVMHWPNPILPPISPPRPLQHPGFAMAPTHAAIWAIISARMAELYDGPPMPDLNLTDWLPSDPLADVRAELQAWLDECQDAK